MALTLNQIISRLRTLAGSHVQLRTFYLGTPEEFDNHSEGQPTDNVYPALFCEIRPGDVDRTNHFINYNFRLYFYDLVKVSKGTEDNETEVLSDMQSVAADFLAMTMFSDYRADWTIKPINAFDPKTEQLNDLVAGVVQDIGISVEFLADRCQVPASSITFETFDMPRTRIFTYDGTGSEGSSFSVSTINGKYVLAAWRNDLYKRVSTSTPTDSGTIKVGTIDGGNGKGILCNGTAVLQNGDALVPGEKVDFLYYN